jgi:DNA-binding HxlR family transcriptional regulator/putative sterol carrier protein
LGRYNWGKVKRYDQFCPIAHALSLVGERWSLLVVRELLEGPKRYTDLAHGLPGIGTNILAARLRDLEDAGVVCKRKLPPPAASTVYELTEYGAELNEALYALARWGARTLGPPKPGDWIDPEWGVNAIPALFDPLAAGELDETWVLQVDEGVFTARFANGCVEAAVGGAENADAVIKTDMESFYWLVAGELEPDEALASGRVEVEGDPSVLNRLVRVLNFAPRARSAQRALPV